MEYYYHAFGTINVIRGENVTGMHLDQLFDYGYKTPVGTVTNTYCVGFYSRTEIRFPEGSLSCYEDYDMPLGVYALPSEIAFEPDPPIPAKSLHEQEYAPVLHKPPTVVKRKNAATFLEENGVFYQIVTREAEKDRLWHTCVFDAACSVVNKQLVHSPLADVVVRKNGPQVEWNVHIRRELPVRMRMAIVSLPFTLEIIGQKI